MSTTNRAGYRALRGLVLGLLVLSGKVCAIASPVTEQVVVPTGLSQAAAFSLDWRYMSTGLHPGGDLAEIVTGHTDVRQARGDGAIRFRGETRQSRDISGTLLVQPEVVTSLCTPGLGITYNAARNRYVRHTYPDPHFIPAAVSPWMDRNGSAVLFALGHLHLQTDPAPHDETLAGVAVRTYVFHSTPQAYTQEGHSYTFQEEIHYSYARATGLPVRYSSLSSVNGSPFREDYRLEITACKSVPSLPDSRFVLDLPKTARALELPRPKEPILLAAGTPAPDFTCIGANGQPVKLSDFRGKVVVLDFWATWCVPCQASLPHLQSVYESLPKRHADAVVLALCVWDEKDAYQKWCARHPEYTFAFAFDPAATDNTKSIPRSLFRVNGIPTQYVIDRDGKVAAARTGQTNPGDTWLETVLTAQGITISGETRAAQAK